jgi:hypothetical protein
LIQPALLGGLFIGVVSALPGVSLGNCCCCLWVVCGGLLASYLLQYDRPAPITTGEGALVGLAAGIVGAVVWLGAAIAVNVMMGPVQERMIEQVLERTPNMPPDVRELFESMRNQDAGPLSYLFGFVVVLGAGTIFSTLGGVLGATLFRRDALPPPAPSDFVPPPVPPLP